jgi:hypothetical protein
MIRRWLTVLRFAAAPGRSAVPPTPSQSGTVRSAKMSCRSGGIDRNLLGNYEIAGRFFNRGVVVPPGYPTREVTCGSLSKAL